MTKIRLSLKSALAHDPSPHPTITRPAASVFARQKMRQRRASWQRQFLVARTCGSDIRVEKHISQNAVMILKVNTFEECEKMQSSDIFR